MQTKLSLKDHFSIVKKMLFFSLRSFPALISTIFILNIIVALIPAVSIWVGKLIIDTIVAMVMQSSMKSLQYLIALIALEFFLMLMQGILNKVSSYINSKYSALFEIQMRQQILQKCETTPYYLFEQPEFYNRFELIMNNVASGSSSYVTQQINLLRAIIKLISISYILIKIDIFFLIAAIALNVANFIIGVKLSNRSFDVDYKLAEPKRISDYFFRLLTQIHNLKDIKLFNLSPFFRKKYKDKNMFILKERLNFFRKELTLYTLFEFVSTLTYYAFYVYIVYGVIKKRLTVGDISLYQRSYSTLDGALNGFISNFTAVYQQNLYMKLYYDFMQDKAETETSVKEAAPINTLTLNNASFAYPSNPDKLILQNISFELKQGDTVLIVGRNGCGKTTLAKLLARLYIPLSGEFLINGSDSEQMSVDAYRKQLGVMLQDFNQYEMTCADNIQLGNVDNHAPQQQLDKTIHQADLGSFVTNLPNGVNTYLSRIFDDGVSPSSGQWQKLALARILYRDPKMIILDEPTANLDHQYSQQVYKLIQQLQQQQNKLICIVTHKKEFLSLTEKIIFIEQNTIAATGNHKELLQTNSSYAALWD